MKRKSAPGPDRINYKMLKKIDQTGKIQSYLFSVIMKNKHAPKCWKTYSTLLIPKPGKKDEEYKNVEN